MKAQGRYVSQDDPTLSVGELLSFTRAISGWLRYAVVDGFSFSSFLCPFEPDIKSADLGIPTNGCLENHGKSIYFFG